MIRYRPQVTAISYSPYSIAILTFFTLLFLAKICIPFELLIGTGDAESFSYFAGKTMCRSIKKYKKDIGCRLAPTRQTADTLTNLQTDSIDMALVSAKTLYDALQGSGSFQYITIDYNELRLLMPLYRSPVSLIVRQDAGIAKLDDLPGKRINTGVLNTLENLTFTKIMNLKKWKKSDFPLYQSLSHAFSQDFLALKSGSVEAMLHVGMHPDNSLKLLLTQTPGTLIGLDDPDIRQFINDREGYSSCSIRAGTYPGISADINTLALETLLVGSSATDDDTVQLVLTALLASRRQLQYAHPSLLEQQPSVAALNESYLIPHPSALRFFSGEAQAELD